MFVVTAESIEYALEVCRAARAAGESDVRMTIEELEALLTIAEKHLQGKP